MKLKKSWHNFVQFIKLIKKDHPSVIIIIVIGALAAALLPFVQLVFYSKILNMVMQGLYEECVLYVAIQLVVTLILGLISQACKHSINVLREACKNSIYLKTADRAFTMEYEEFEKTETMDEIRRVKGGENGSGDIGSQIHSIYVMTEQALMILFSFAFVLLLFVKTNTNHKNFFTSSWSTASIIAMFTVVMIICYKLSVKSYEKYYQMSKDNEHFNSLSYYLFTIGINYQNGKDIRIYSMQQLLNKYLKGVMEKANRYYLSWGISDGKYTGIITLLTQIASGVVYAVIGVKAMYGVINVGEVLMYAGAVLQLTSSIRSEVTEFNSFTYRAEYLNTYYEFINRPNKHYKGTLPIEKRADADFLFTLENVSFRYPNTKDMILQNINLKFKVGEKFAVVGRNGAGKTTLIKLLCRLYEPTEGRILLNGIDIKYYDYAEYTKIFSVVFQDFKLLSLPLEDNVAAGEEIDRGRMWRILEQVGMKERVERISDQLHTKLYRNNGDGVEISGGEAQKLAIARALYKDGPFVILDEPTAALDPISEAEIYEHFNEMIQGRTAIYISHRMSSCKFCDDIVVLEQGQIAERGNHQTLMRMNGIYASLYNTQAQYYTA